MRRWFLILILNSISIMCYLKHIIYILFTTKYTIDNESMNNTRLVTLKSVINLYPLLKHIVIIIAIANIANVNNDTVAMYFTILNNKLQFFFTFLTPLIIYLYPFKSSYFKSKYLRATSGYFYNMQLDFCISI